MRLIQQGMMFLATAAFVALPMLAAGCADSTTAPAGGGGAAATSGDGSDSHGSDTHGSGTQDDLGDLGDLNEEIEAGSGLSFPEAGSAIE